MKKIAAIFPGFGCYNMEFLKEFFKKYDSIKQTFIEASDIMKKNLYNRFFNEDNQSVYKNKNSYLLIFLSSIAIYRLLKEKTNFVPQLMVGHSLGQYSALVCNNNISFKEAIRIIKIRQKIMLLAVKKTKILTLIIMGLNYHKIKKVCLSVSTIKKKSLFLLLTQKIKSSLLAIILQYMLQV